MKQITRAIYIVQPHEDVTIEVEATKVGNFVTFSLDGSAVDAVPGVTPLTFRFQISVAPGFDQFGIISCHFPVSAPDDAEYQIFVTGSGGGGRFTGSNILKTDLSWTRSIEFRCM
jgi:hypothetical protein